MPLVASLLTFAPPPGDSAGDLSARVRRIAATTQLAAQEYRLGVSGGRVVAPQEVAEAALFLKEARTSAIGLGDGAAVFASRVDSLIALVAATSAPDTVDARVRALSSDLSTRFGVALDQPPASAPSLARGEKIYRAECAGCHGDVGRGDGPLAKGLDPAPPNLAEWHALREQTPLDYYRRISVGTVGTAMPAFENRLPAEDRWSVALYASLLRLPAPSGEVPPALRAFANTGRMSDQAILSSLGLTAEPTRAALGRVAAVRAFRGDTGAAATARVFRRVRSQVDSAVGMARTGDPMASTRALDAYMTFEEVERTVRAKDPAVASEVESAFAALRTLAGSGSATPAQLGPVESRLAVALEKAERTLGDDLSPVGLFVQSLIIMLREGLEAILIVGALMTFLTRMGAADRKREINFGVGAAVVASLITALALETVFILSPAKREALEGATVLLATGVLFYVSYWLLSKMEVVRWNHFVKSKVADALGGGSTLALASAAFLAVYREGFETVLFYKALFVAATASGAMPVAGGMAVGALLLVVVYLAIDRFGVRLPLKPFFAVTSAFLYYMAFVFAGTGIAELQEGGTISTTVAPWAPRIPALGIYPTVESLAAQGLLLVLAVAALVWTFVLEPRRPAAARRVPESIRPPSTDIPASSSRR
ncbi:MAG TPA: FTR1 family protein [Gemmatimonadales bacterium]